MNQAFAFKISLKIYKTNIRAQKIDKITLKTNEIIVFIFFLFNKDRYIRFFEYINLLANVSLDTVLEILFLIISNVDIDFETQDMN